MFYIGNWNKQEVIDFYLKHNEVERVLVIYNPRLYPRFVIPETIPHEFLEYGQSIQYKNYYRLLQWVNKRTLIISDELLITENRYQLEYNCINAFLNQTPQRLVFSYLPFINHKENFMILLDQYNSALYKGEQFEWDLVKQVKTFIKPVHLEFNFINVEITDKEKEKYQAERDKLFEEIGMKDPDTIPRRLAITAGNFRADKVGLFEEKFTCRNLRLKKLNCSTYKEDELNTIMDFPTKRQDLIALLTVTKQTKINALTSQLSIDVYNKKDTLEWINKLEEFYAKATLPRHECGGSGSQEDFFSF